MDLQDSSAAENAILAVLSGTPIKEAAAQVRSSPGRLAEAVELYRSGGRSALDAGMQTSGRTLADAGQEGRLTLGTRAILARHILFHWNRLGFTTQQQAMWARAAREAMLGHRVI